MSIQHTPLAADGTFQVHAPDHHAEITAAKLVVLADDAPENIRTVARDLRKKIEVILTLHHQRVHDDEQSKLSTLGMEHANKFDGPAKHDDENDPFYSVVRDENWQHPLRSEDHVTDEIVHEIMNAAQGTPLGPHFSRNEMQAAIREVLHQETKSQMNVHRMVHRSNEQLKNKPRLVK